MLDMLSGETLLYPIIGDPIRFAESPQRLTKKFEERGHNGICVPMSVPENSLESLVSPSDATTQPVANSLNFRHPPAELQIPPLRCAPVGMTKSRVVDYLECRDWAHSARGTAN